MASKMRDRLLGDGGLKSCRTERVVIVQDGDRRRIRRPPVDGADPDQALDVVCDIVIRQPTVAELDRIRKHWPDFIGHPPSRAIAELLIIGASDGETGERFTEHDVEALLSQPSNGWVEEVAVHTLALTRPPEGMGKA